MCTNEPPTERAETGPAEQSARLESEVFDCAVIGGGITGLAVAWRLLRDAPYLRVVVLESADQAGGKIRSVELAGHRIDAGPDAFLSRVSGAVELAEELGLADDLVAPATGQAWLWSQDQLHRLPAGLVLGVPSDPHALGATEILSSDALARALASDSGAASVGDVHLELVNGDVSVAAGIGAHLGMEVVERLVDPLLGGINASDCQRLSLKSASADLFAAVQQPRLMEALRTHMVQVRGQTGVTEDRPVFQTPSGGVHVVVDELVRTLGATVRTNAPVQNLTRVENDWAVMTRSTTLRARTVVLATPAAASARLLEHVAPLITAELGAIRTASVALTLLAYPNDAVRLPPGSGMLVARADGHLLTAASWWSQKWPHLDTGDYSVIRASTGRDGDTRFCDLTDEQLVAALHAELSEVLAIRTEPFDAVVTRWMGGFPQYDVGHTARVGRIEAMLAEEPSLALAGASYRGIGIPACIRDANAAARQIITLLGQ